MADKDFVVKNGLITGTNTATFGTAAYIASNGNVGIANTTPADKLVVTGNIIATSNISAAYVNASSGFYGTVQTATQGTINHNSLSNFVANKHIDHTSVSISAGNGLTGGGDISSTRSLSVVAGTGISVNSIGVHVSNVPNSLTFSSGGAGDANGNTFNGSASKTISYNSIGAFSATGSYYIGTTSLAINRVSGSVSLSGVSIDGSAGSATNAGYATSAGSATNATYATSAGSATNASAATNATYATSAGSATNATYATSAGSATNATTATNQSGGTVSATTGTFSSTIIQTGSGTAPGTSSAWFSTAAYGISQGDNKTHFGYNNGTSYVNYIRGASTEHASSVFTIGGYQAVYNSGTWSININGSAASATNATYATSAGSAGSATNASAATNATYASSSGQGTCVAWVNFNGTGSTGANASIYGSNNVSYVYKNGQGDYTVYFNTSPTVNQTSASYQFTAGGIQNTPMGGAVYSVGSNNVRINPTWAGYGANRGDMVYNYLAVFQ